MKRVWSVIYSNKKNSPKPNNADFWYFTDKTIIKTCTKIHFVMNLFPVSSHIWLHWPDYCFLKKFYCIIYDTTRSKTIFILIRKKKKNQKQSLWCKKSDECWPIKVIQNQTKPTLWVYRNRSIEFHCNSVNWFLYIHNIDLISVFSFRYTNKKNVYLIFWLSYQVNGLTTQKPFHSVAL